MGGIHEGTYALVNSHILLGQIKVVLVIREEVVQRVPEEGDGYGKGILLLLYGSEFCVVGKGNRIARPFR